MTCCTQKPKAFLKQRDFFFGTWLPTRFNRIISMKYYIDFGKLVTNKTKIIHNVDNFLAVRLTFDIVFFFSKSCVILSNIGFCNRPMLH